MKPVIRQVQAAVIKTELESEFNKDIWDGRKIGADIKPSDKLTLNFSPISIGWLGVAAKRFIKYTFSTLTWSSCQDRLSAIKRFSRFLDEFYPQCQPAEIDRSLILEFLSYLASKKYSNNTRISNISYLQNFFYLCHTNRWAEVQNLVLFLKGDAPRVTRTLPKFIPQEVLDKLNQALDCLPDPIMRMVLILQECGMRISELCRLKFDCLTQDIGGDWWLTYYQFKMSKEHSICISKEVAAVILEQQEYIKEHFGRFKYLFCARKVSSCGINFIPAPQPINVESFALYLNNLASNKNICTPAGELWHFTAHQFRHTVATRMINGDVPIHIVKRYLGHESFEMTMRYVHIHEKNLKKEFNKYYGKTVNITGQVIESPAPELDLPELQWFKKNILAQALPNGSCALPTIAQECPHANACLSCTHFRTTAEFLEQHKEQLKQTEKIVEKAKASGWQRQVEMNERIKTNLQNIITALESDDAKTR